MDEPEPLIGINADPLTQSLKARWLDEFAEFERNRGRDKASDKASELRLMTWWKAMKDAGIDMTDLELIEAGIDPWSNDDA